MSLKNAQNRIINAKTSLHTNNPNSLVNKCRKCHKKYGHIIYGLIIGLTFVASQVTVGLILNFTLFSTKATSDTTLLDKQKITAIFILIFLPCFLTFGIVIIGSRLPRSQRFMVYTLFLAIPFCIGMRVFYHAYAKQNYQQAQPMLKIMIYASPGIGIFWVTMLCIQRRHPMLYIVLLAISFTLIVIPMFVIYPLVDLQLGQFQDFWRIICIIVAGCGVVLIIFAILMSIVCRKRSYSKNQGAAAIFGNKKKKIKKPSKLNSMFSIKADFRNCAFWLNSVCGILSSAIVAAIWSQYDFTDSQLKFSFMISMPLTLFLVFLIDNYLLGLKIHRPPGYEKSNILDQQVYQNFLIFSISIFGNAFKDITDYDKNLLEKQIKRQARKQAFFSGFGIFFPPAIALPVYFFALDNSHQRYRLSSLTVMGGLIASALITIALLQLKKRCGPYAKSGLPICISLKWILILIPFCLVLPSSIIVAGDDNSIFQVVIQSAIGFMIFMLFILATILSIVLNHVLKRLEYEKRARYCVTELHKQLREKAVRSTNLVLRILFDNFVLVGRDQFHQKLQNKDLAYYWDVSDYDPDPRFSKILVQPKTLQELQKKSGKQKAKADYSQLLMEKKRQQIEAALKRKRQKQEMKRNRKSCLRRACACCFEDDGDDQLAMQAEEQIEQRKELQQQKRRRSQAELEKKRRLEMGGSILQDSDVQDENMVDFSQMLQRINRKKQKKLSIQPQENKEKQQQEQQKRKQFMKSSQEMIKSLIQTIKSSNDLDAVKQLVAISNEAQNLFIKKLFFNFASGQPSGKYINPWMKSVDLVKFNQLIERPYDKQLAQITINNRYKKIQSQSEGKIFGDSEFKQFLKQQARRYASVNNLDQGQDLNDVNFSRYLVEKIYNKIIIVYPLFSKSSFNIKLCQAANEALNAKMRTKNFKNLIRKKKKNKRRKGGINSGRISLGSSDRQDIFSQHQQQQDQQQQYEDADDYASSFSGEGIDNFDFNLIGTQNNNNLNDTIDQGSEENFQDEEEEQDQEAKRQRELRERKLRKWRSYSSSRRCCIKCNRCLGVAFNGPRKFCTAVCSKLGSCCIISSTKESEKEQAELDNDQKYYSKKRKGAPKKIRHLRSPQWEQISNICVQNIDQSLDDYYTIQLGQDVGKFNCNFGNLTLMVIKIFEFISFVVFCFQKEIGWNFSSTASSAITAVNLQVAQTSTYPYFFWGSVIIAFIYILILPRSARRAKNGTLGMDKDGRPAKLCTLQFLFARLTIILASSAYTGVIKNLFDTFACDLDEKPYELHRDPAIQCFAGTHYLYISVGLFTLVAYYPLATFMYANLQFVNKASDLKYNPNFMVYLAQSKLIIAILASFFSSTDTKKLSVRIGLSSAAMFFLAFLSYKQQPCIIQKANIWHTMGYLICGWIILSTEIVVVLQSSIFAAISMGSGAIVIVVVTVLIYKCKYIEQMSKTVKIHTANVNFGQGALSNSDQLQPSNMLRKRIDKRRANLSSAQTNNQRGGGSTSSLQRPNRNIDRSQDTFSPQ